MTEVIRGTCLSMCPKKEQWIREKEGLLHMFEIDERTRGKRMPKADPRRTVKSFSRPAAGLVMTDPNQLRPAPVLLSTIRYLFTEIATRTDVDWAVVYDFIFDRLRSVRQDAAIQRIDVHTNIELSAAIVRFLVYSAQRLCERSINEFSVNINDQHLTECTTRLLCLYDEFEMEPVEMVGDTLHSDREQMEALYILVNMGNSEVLTRALQLATSLRRSTVVRLAMKISLAWYLKNYVRVCVLISQLSPILICAAMCNIRKLRRVALKIMSVGYNSKVLQFPGRKLQEILLYKDIEKVGADCKLFGLAFAEGNILFEKVKFKDQVDLASPEMYYAPEAMHNLLPDILLKSK